MGNEKVRGSTCMLSLAVLLLLLPVLSFADVMRKEEGTRRVALDLKSATVKEFFDALRQQTGLSFVYNSDVETRMKQITIRVEAETVDNVLNTVFKDSGFSYHIDGNNIVTIYAVSIKESSIAGAVYNEERVSLPGVTVRVKGENIGTATTADGTFTITIPGNLKDPVLIFSFIGMRTKEVPYKGEYLTVIMEEDIVQVGEIVATGIFTRKVETFTGASTTISGDDLKRVSNQNVFQSLKTLDPSVYIPDNLTMGSDPNTVPSISMRGVSSFPLEETTSLRSSYQRNPNQPLFILDGFETTAEYIMDMDMNRVESITILKDASAKAIYGSKAANGVIVIETKRLTGNKQRVTYNGSLSLEMPDLTSYDLCNIWEKLEVEVLEGMYTNIYYINTQLRLSRLYNSRKKLALEGLDTYWLSKPLRTGAGHKHNINVELGDSESLRTMLNITFNRVDGAMKESYRQNISGDVNVSYRSRNMTFRNILSIISGKSENSPYGTFSDYAKMNPYWQATDENGKVLRWAETEGLSYDIPNPLYDATTGTSFTSTYLQFTNNFYVEWLAVPDLKLTARFGVSEKRNDADDFYPPDHSMFARYYNENILRKGKYVMENGKSSSLSGDVNANFNKTLGKHGVFANAGFFVSQDKYSAYQHTAEGFSNSRLADITFARQYAEGVTPVGYAGINRQMSFLLAASYDYDNRYMVDATVRESASSLYGADSRWANSWSAGIGWNLHNESFLKNLGFIGQLKLRGSAGLTGNQNFLTNEAIGTYKYFTGVVYGGFTGAYLNNMPNSDLKWEQKLDYNIGLDARIAGLSLALDYYTADTKNMLTNVTIPTSTGFSTVKDNLGLVRNSGVEAKANYTFWQGKDGFINVYGTFIYTKNKIVSLSESMRAYNEKMQKMAEDSGNSTPVLMYQDGLSMNTIWAMPSAGIDPQTGKEVYIKKDGTLTYDYDATQLVPAGDATQKYRGTGGFTTEYKGIGLTATVSYLAGCDMYNYTLVSRVENADITYNVDRRIFLGRWKEPGQVTQFKKFQSGESTRSTTRFVQSRRELNLSSVSAYYEFPESVYGKLSMERLRLAFHMNDIATFSSIKIERGLSYPFARNMSFSLTATF